MFRMRRMGPFTGVIAVLLLGMVVVSCGSANDGTAVGVAASDTPAVTASAASTSVPSSIGVADTATQPTITVNGVGIVSLVPDTARLQIGATATDASVTTALNDVDQRIQAIIKVLHDSGIPDTDIKTSMFNVMTQYDYSAGTQKVTGYVVTHMLRLSVSPADKAGEIIGAAVDAGANQIYEVTFTTADSGSATQQARGKAINDALTRAQQFAQAAGMEVGAPISISEGTLVSPYTNKISGSAAIPAAGAGAAVEPGQQEIEVDVTVTYELK